MAKVYKNRGLEEAESKAVEKEAKRLRISENDLLQRIVEAAAKSNFSADGSASDASKQGATNPAGTGTAASSAAAKDGEYFIRAGHLWRRWGVAEQDEGSCEEIHNSLRVLDPEKVERAFQGLLPFNELNSLEITRVKELFDLGNAYTKFRTGAQNMRVTGGRGPSQSRMPVPYQRVESEQERLSRERELRLEQKRQLDRDRQAAAHPKEPLRCPECASLFLSGSRQSLGFHLETAHGWIDGRAPPPKGAPSGHRCFLEECDKKNLYLWEDPVNRNAHMMTVHGWNPQQITEVGVNA